MWPRNLMLALDLQILACQALKLGMTNTAEAYIEGKDLLRSAGAPLDIVMHESASERIREGQALFSGIDIFYEEYGPERGREFATVMDRIFKEKHAEKDALKLGPSSKGSTDEEARAFEAFLRDSGPMSRGGNA